MTLFLIGLVASFITLVGGYLALYFKDRLHLILGFSAGTVVAVALFDLIPEAINLGGEFYKSNTIMTGVVIGFLFFLVINRFIALSSDESGVYREHTGPALLTLHSVLDGVAIGLAFHVSIIFGWLVAVAILVHDFSDGINTVNLNLIFSDKNTKAKYWLLADALAPLLGIMISVFILIEDRYLSLTLAFFAGSFLYIGASELIPESHHRHPFIWTSISTILGVVVMYMTIYFAGL